MAKPNYQYEKRARELAKKKKKEEKLKHKQENAAKAAAQPGDGTEGSADAAPEAQLPGDEAHPAGTP